MQSHRPSPPPPSPPPPLPPFGRDGCRISMTKRRWDAFSSLLLIPPRGRCLSIQMRWAYAMLIF